MFASDTEQVDILAHSMGSRVTVEALRQIKISGRPPDSGKLGSIFLAAPDIDIDVLHRRSSCRWLSRSWCRCSICSMATSTRA
ncbi:alpha/beta hydrolase [Bosea sp. LjRoot9]|uniref:alpha/beta hydrolase n=1 Tax=Bosea sp. LjRoot9 TaxID=3342341 RepID=UPI003ECCA8EE